LGEALPQFCQDHYRMKVSTYRPDDPELAQHVRASAVRGVEAAPKRPLPQSYDPRFGEYIAGKLDTPPETIMVEVKRATKEEVVELPDGRQIQIQAKDAPVVDEKLAERERELAQRATEAAQVDHLSEIQPEEGARALATGTVPNTKVRPLGPEAAKGK
jgi:hypothetical protein